MHTAHSLDNARSISCAEASIHQLSRPYINDRCTDCTQVALRVENTPTLDAVVMTQSVMLVQATRVPEELVTSLAILMFIEAVSHQVFVVCKADVTLATEGMPGTLDKVLPESGPRGKVLITVLAVVVIRRV